MVLKYRENAMNTLIKVLSEFPEFPYLKKLISNKFYLLNCDSTNMAFSVLSDLIKVNNVAACGPY